MATLQQKIKAEQELRELLRRGDLPEPDEVEYGETCIRAIWWDMKRAVVIDIDEPPHGQHEEAERYDAAA